MIIRRVIAYFDKCDNGKIMVGEVVLIMIIAMVPVINIVMLAAAMVFTSFSMIAYVLDVVMKSSKSSIFGRSIEDVISDLFK
jgi:hypothetical protein